MKSKCLFPAIMAGFLLFLFCEHLVVNAAQNNKEELMEEVLLKHYSTSFTKITEGKAYYCERINHMERLNGDSTIHKVETQLITYEGAHNPPYDLYKIMLKDGPPGQGLEPEITILDVDMEQDISAEQAKGICN
ncbi:hypothetical protein KO561_14165 [Radiobacillus kanasensis]|uniref:hypothetical protein n=1 Tax=Radiobacillus kanasensis TaxID=2844358 RepID=UPI001E54B9C5|nr:hypothetical protein [Radiobacillus kanasensis]UFT98339.1 hypothetical protein KO561_14165 [Radiobacillus kanasensis]